VNFGEPEVDGGEHAEHRAAEQHVVHVRHHEVRVVELEVERRGGEQHAGEAAEEEREQEAEAEQHRRLEREAARSTWCRSS
jgi:hypothetical protein